MSLPNIIRKVKTWPILFTPSIEKWKILMCEAVSSQLVKH